MLLAFVFGPDSSNLINWNGAIGQPVASQNDSHIQYYCINFGVGKKGFSVELFAWNDKREFIKRWNDALLCLMWSARAHARFRML